VSSGSNVLWIGSVFWFSRRQPPPSWIFFLQKFDILTFARDCGVDRRHRAIFNQNRSSGCGGDTAISRGFFQHGGRPPSWICWMWLIVCVCVVNEAIEMPVAGVNSWAQGFVCLLMGTRVAHGNGHVWGHRSRIRGVPFQNSHKFKNFTSSKKHVNIRKKL